MTNGEKIKEIFPNAEINYGLRGVVAITFIHKTIFDLDWWNAEYQEPSGSEKSNKTEIPTGSDDCISREQAKAAIRDKFKDLPSRVEINTILNELPSANTQEPRWIPCSERLPEEREWYLAVFKEIDTGYQLIPRVADYIGNGGNEWQIIDEDGLGQEYRSILECVAWMPLPEPYKPQESEG